MSVNLVQFITICILLVAILIDVTYIAKLLTLFVTDFWDFMNIEEEEEDK